MYVFVCLNSVDLEKVFSWRFVVVDDDDDDEGDSDLWNHVVKEQLELLGDVKEFAYVA